MTMPSNVVYLTRARKDSFNPSRSLNLSLRNQLAYFLIIGQSLAADLQTGIDVSAITEGEASSCIAKLTRALYTEGARQKELRYQELIERKYLTGLTDEDEVALRAVTEELSVIDEHFYSSVIERLKNRIVERGYSER
jgi:hypothetical protein